ncbi:hypothetical protein M527_07115 [Sphingobium indicum IP26]|uniref:Uncharacterized protein n=2 Tax=Sphingomonadaceae TaxID=41297 RepID=A0A8E1C385_9SPHN|nr:hypothetical protein M527_07115 [Sphingobium indicum IP26]EQB05015.1 hypothetical protein L286_09630 [Sphingobium sp. HDIP04]KER36683.1 hypothetical protein AL00_09415 [Sphingobium indicum F2]
MAAFPHDLVVKGITIGHFIGETREKPRTAQGIGPIIIDLHFRPNWPGLWHVMALMADQPGDDERWQA